MGQLLTAGPIRERLRVFDEAFLPPWVSGAVQRNSLAQKQKAPAFIDRNARALEMSCSASSWRLYPERSITPHNICGSGRLFPGLETRRAKTMIELVVTDDHEQSERGKSIPQVSGCQQTIPNCAQWLGTESNRRHADFQSAALPTELPSRTGLDIRKEQLKRLVARYQPVRRGYFPVGALP